MERRAAIQALVISLVGVLAGAQELKFNDTYKDTYKVAGMDTLNVIFEQDYIRIRWRARKVKVSLAEIMDALGPDEVEESTH